MECFSKGGGRCCRAPAADGGKLFAGYTRQKTGKRSREKQPRGLCNIDKVQRRKGRKRGQIASQKEKNGRFAGIWANAGLFSMVFRQAPIY